MTQFAFCRRMNAVNRIRNVLIALLWLTALACDGVAAATQAILVFGDSLSAPYGIAEKRGWVSLLIERLEKERLDYRVVNASISGETTSGGRGRLAKVLADHKPAVVILELGGNDGLRGLPPEELRKNLTAIVRAARERHVAVVLCGMEAPPNAGPAYATAFREAFSRVARDEHVPFVRFVLDKVAGIEGLNQQDGIHPNARGARLVADTVWPALQPLLDPVSRS